MFPPFEMFLQDRAPVVGWEAIEPVCHLTLDQVKVEQLWKEYDDVAERAEDRGCWMAIDDLEQAVLLAQIDELMEGLED